MHTRFALALLTCLSGVAASQQSMIGYSAASAGRERELEASAVKRPSPTVAAAHSKQLSRETHVAGTPAQERTRDYVIDQMKKWGIETQVRTYDVWMPHPTSVHVAKVSPQPKELALTEPPVAGDPTSSLWQYPTVNGYSGEGDVTGDVVFVNYGLIEDYARLDSMGVSVRGKIAVARYGRSFRGIKAREAERNGAVGLLIYSDPQRRWICRGDVYPDGPMRNWNGVQRGSVMNGAGDPATPGYPSTRSARRLDTGTDGHPAHPVVPISLRQRERAARRSARARHPERLAGRITVSLSRRAGAGPARASQVTDDRATKDRKPIYDTFGMIRGSEFPDELVIVGGHRDAWGPGAADNVSGTVSVLEAARAVAEAVKAGASPATDHRLRDVGCGGVGTHRLDRVRRGRLRCDCVEAPSRISTRTSRRKDRDSAAADRRRCVRSFATSRAWSPTQMAEGSVYSEWRRASARRRHHRTARWGTPAVARTSPASTITWEFRSPSGDSAASGGVYHSQYDDFAWMTKFGDPDFRITRRRRESAAMLLRLANADILPYDYVEFARTMQRYVAPIDSAVSKRHGMRRRRRFARRSTDSSARAAHSTRRATPRLPAGGDRDVAAGESRVDAGGARVDSSAGPAHAAVVSQSHIRCRREQRLRQHGHAIGQRSDPCRR